MVSIKKYIENDEDNTNFIIIVGDNYYPDYKGKNNTLNYNNFKSVFDCLVNIDVKFKEVPFKTASYTIIDGDIKILLMMIKLYVHK